MAINKLFILAVCATLLAGAQAQIAYIGNPSSCVRICLLASGGCSVISESCLIFEQAVNDYAISTGSLSQNDPPLEIGGPDFDTACIQGCTALGGSVIPGPIVQPGPINLPSSPAIGKRP